MFPPWAKIPSISLQGGSTFPGLGRFRCTAVQRERRRALWPQVFQCIIAAQNMLFKCLNFNERIKPAESICISNLPESDNILQWSMVISKDISVVSGRPDNLALKWARTVTDEDCFATVLYNPPNQFSRLGNLSTATELTPDVVNGELRRKLTLTAEIPQRTDRSIQSFELLWVVPTTLS